MIVGARVAAPFSGALSAALVTIRLRGSDEVIVLCFVSDKIGSPAALLHEPDNGDRRARFAENYDAEQHDEAVELLIDQVEGEHAVNEGARQEDQAQKDRD